MVVAGPTYTLSNGYKVPFLGLGTWQSPPDGSVYRAVRDALSAGYRHIDCAYAYENEPEIGKAIQDAIKEGVLKREDLFVTSKLWLTFYRSDRVEINVRKMLANLQLDYLDLCLLHWPVSLKQVDDTIVPADADGNALGGGVDYLEAYQALEKCVEKGLVRSIGVSNFIIPQLERLLAVAKVKPVTNQVELHPYLVQLELKEFCNKNGIVLTAYSPLGNPGSTANDLPEKDKLLKDPVVLELAKKYGKNPGQILIKFQIAQGNLVIPKSVNKDRIVSNFDVFDFELTPEEVKRLQSLDRGYRSCTFDFIAKLPNYPFPKN